MQIDVCDLVKTYHPPRSSAPIRSLFTHTEKKEPIRAVDGISFAIEKGEFVGFVGHNGAGKSTTVKLLTGLLLPTAGRVSVLERDPFTQRRQNNRHIGVMFGQRSQLWWDLPISDVFALHRHLYEIPPGVYQAQVKIMEDMLELKEFIATPVRQLSLGQRMRGEIAVALLHDPEILFLDEPTIGMDFMVKERIRAFLVEINRRRGTTILLTTHDLNEIERSCRRVMVINRGKLLYDGTLASLRQRASDDVTVTVQVDRVIPPGLFCRLRDAEEMEDGRIRFHLSRERGEMDLLADLFRDAAVRNIEMEEPPIEAVVRDLFGPEAAQ